MTFDNLTKRILGAALAATFATASAHAAPVGALAIYDFDSSDATDSSGNGNDGTILGGVRFTGSFNGTTAAEFTAVSGLSGIDTGIDIQASALPAITMGAWVNLSEFSTTVGGKILSDDNGSFDRTLGFDDRGNDPGRGYAAFTGAGVVDAPDAITPGEWRHLAVSYDGALVRLYLDGLLVDSATDSTVGDVTSFALFIGTNPGFNEDFIGLLDDVFLYGRALSDAEVFDIFENGFGAEIPIPPAFGLFGAGAVMLFRMRRRKSAS